MANLATLPRDLHFEILSHLATASLWGPHPFVTLSQQCRRLHHSVEGFCQHLLHLPSHSASAHVLPPTRSSLARYLTSTAVPCRICNSRTHGMGSLNPAVTGICSAGCDRALNRNYISLTQAAADFGVPESYARVNVGRRLPGTPNWMVREKVAEFALFFHAGRELRGFFAARRRLRRSAGSENEARILLAEVCENRRKELAAVGLSGRELEEELAFRLEEWRGANKDLLTAAIERRPWNEDILVENAEVYRIMKEGVELALARIEKLAKPRDE
ncbi:hypothetical protein FN846DRAFT_888131 [Sphaerosporella brunnea]|uniref:F-box domain-containing protein n=1 Tax=Sphaerosporella brunnea TaxID=1250544 RepID=A0A5J5F3R8_9PEZI|nr:hypothetical protein FN846DRAFT_888131 [Sphaerosporella brunnea]